MKTLYESLLDDFDTLNKKTHDGILKDIDETYLKNTWFKVGKDGKTIIIEPTRQDYISDDRDVTPYVEWYTRNRERSLSSPDVKKEVKMCLTTITY